LKILFLATYFPRPLNPTIGTWALEQAKAFQRASEEAQSREGSSELRVTSGDQSAGGTPATSNPPPVTSFRVVSGNSWFPKIAGKMKAGIQVYSGCPRNHSWDGVQVDYLPMLFYPFGKLDAIFNRVGEPMLQLGWWSIKGRLMKIVEEFQPDVVYAHHTVPNGYFAFRIHKQTGIPFVVTDHEMGEITACETFSARRAVYEKVISLAYRMVSVAGVMRKDMERVFPQARCEVIHNGMNLSGQVETLKEDLTTEDTESTEEEDGAHLASQAGALEPDSLTSQLADSPVSESRTRFASGPAFSPATRNSLPANAPEAPPIVILSCGMFYERKNFPGLIQAFNLVAAKYPQVVLRIFGDGPDRIKVEQARDASPFKDRIKMPGKVSHAEVLQQMQEADVFALIGWREPFATVFLEAMAAGLPVIACNDGGIAEVIAGVELPEKLKLGNAEMLKPIGANGLLVPPRDIPAAARALEFLILNPEARKQIGEAARKKIEAELTWDAVARKYLEMFEEARRSNRWRDLKSEA
jgi:glycosyltransferase involved in cell wall biosynthesis